MRFIKLFSHGTLMCFTLAILATACSSEESQTPDNVTDQINKNTLIGGWTSKVTNSDSYPITKGDNGCISNSKGELKSTYKVSYDYIIFHDGPWNSNGYAQYFNGIYGAGDYYVSTNKLVYGGKAKICMSINSPMKPTNQDIEIISYTYNSSKNLLTSAVMMVPSISRSEKTFTNQLESKTIKQCQIVPNITGKSFYYETWEEDQNGNILNYINHGEIGNGGNDRDRFLVFTSMVYMRVTSYGNTEPTYGSYDLTKMANYQVNLIWD